MIVQYRNADGTFVALVDDAPYHVTEGDPLYAECLVWAESIGYSSVPAPVPPSRGRRSIHVAWFKAALKGIGKLDDVNAAVATLTPVKQILWEYATTIKEDDADVVAVANALSIDLGDLFDEAESIRDSRS